MPENTNPEDDLFEVALLGAPGPGRAAFLDAECGNDPKLRARVELMLEGHRRCPSSRSEDVMVAVGFSPRFRSIKFFRRGATVEAKT